MDAVEHLATTFGVDELLLALVIAPIATELPEKFNSVLWVRQGKDTLAMGNITGAMVFQSTIPTVVALVFASNSWVVGPGSYIAFASAGIAFLSSAFIFIPMARSGRLRGRGLLVGGVFYLVYLGLWGSWRPASSAEKPRPTDILGALVQGALTRMISQKSAETPAPDPASRSGAGGARRPHLLLRGRITSRCATPRSAS